MYETAVYRIRFQGAFDDSWLPYLGTEWTIQYNDRKSGRNHDHYRSHL